MVAVVVAVVVVTVVVTVVVVAVVAVAALAAVSSSNTVIVSDCFLRSRTVKVLKLWVWSRSRMLLEESKDRNTIIAKFKNNLLSLVRSCSEM